MRRFLIVGASQAGLHLAHALLDHDYDVTLITSQTSDEIRRRKPPLIGVTVPRVLALERARSLHFWSDRAPRLDGLTLSIGPDPRGPLTSFSGEFADGAATAVDRRVKCADWLEAFESRGGNVVIHGITLGDLDYFSRMYDQVIVAVGDGELGTLFDPDPHRMPVTRSRVVTQVLFEEEGVSAPPRRAVSVTSRLGVYFESPMLTEQGTVRAVFVASRPGGPLDCSEESRRSARILEVFRTRVREYFPSVADRVVHAEPMFGPAVTVQRITPTVRVPVAVLPGGGLVLGVGDVLCTSDPVTARVAAEETMCAERYVEAIRAHGHRPFDRDALHAVFDHYYGTDGRTASEFTRTISQWWEHAPQEHVRSLVAAAGSSKAVADWWVQSYDRPWVYNSLLRDPEAARALLTEAHLAHR
ncbi:oxygenase [Spiractinospora alimapuensis]|uniref:styrene monooxygenase/indole monooxygenase family protein n=1 Tax=Spiractinospora alimapuensis TaxID=2820884 RepID=UPI001F1681C4|nr:styrene monooxygenase/indole monooxygenase family protein [Spiractinospora alimapuensis]QVQ50830.1 oxygenase [Spiractinospora alimapuensis]